jgi:hypothetical protein
MTFSLLNHRLLSAPPYVRQNLHVYEVDEAIDGDVGLFKLVN